MVVCPDLQDVGGGPSAAVHSFRCSESLVLLTVCGERSAAVQSIQEVQGELKVFRKAFT